MGPEKPLPFTDDFADADAYVESLLSFGTSNQLLQTLCGGIHILDFFTREPELYKLILSEEWRDWFADKDIYDLLELFCKADLHVIARSYDGSNGKELGNGFEDNPPLSLIQYLADVRRHCLVRDFGSGQANGAKRSLTRWTSVGMKPKKAHEVDNFAHYLNDLTESLQTSAGKSISHLVDFGAGQNPLGRALAAAPYNQHIIAIESRPHVVELAKKMDILAKVVPKDKKIIDKRAWRAKVEAGEMPAVDPTSKSSLNPHFTTENGSWVLTGQYVETVRAKLERPERGKGTVQYVSHSIQDGDLAAVIDEIVEPLVAGTETDVDDHIDKSEGKSDGVKHDPALLVMSLHSCGNLLHHGLRTITLNESVQAVAMVGCCYNLMTERLGPPTYKIPELRPRHPRLEETSSARDPHGFPMSDRFATYRHKILRGRKRQPATSAANPEQHNDTAQPSSTEASSPNMHTVTTPTTNTNDCSTQTITDEDEIETGLRLNITSRMMAVQAPENWTPQESDSFFTRHFYRALLQRIFLDKGVVSRNTNKPRDHISDDEDEYYDPGPGRSPAGTGGTDPIIIGTLGKKCYTGFLEYVRGACAKIEGQRVREAKAEEEGRKKGGEQALTLRGKTAGLNLDNDPPPKTAKPAPSASKSLNSAIASLISIRIATMTDSEILAYHDKFLPRKKDLAVIWSLMAVSAGVIESMIVVDRWLWLKEQDVVGEAWAEAVFEYGQSPRNLVVVGVRK